MGRGIFYGGFQSCVLHGLAVAVEEDDPAQVLEYQHQHHGGNYIDRGFHQPKKGAEQAVDQKHDLVHPVAGQMAQHDLTLVGQIDFFLFQPALALLPVGGHSPVQGADDLSGHRAQQPEAQTHQVGAVGEVPQAEENDDAASQGDKAVFEPKLRSVYKELHADRETGC